MRVPCFPQEITQPGAKPSLNNDCLIASPPKGIWLYLCLRLFSAAVFSLQRTHLLLRDGSQGSHRHTAFQLPVGYRTSARDFVCPAGEIASGNTSSVPLASLTSMLPPSLTELPNVERTAVGRTITTLTLTSLLQPRHPFLACLCCPFSERLDHDHHHPTRFISREASSDLPQRRAGCLSSMPWPSHHLCR